MDLSFHQTPSGRRWAVDGKLLPADFSLGILLELPVRLIKEYLQRAVLKEDAAGPMLAPIDPYQEVWASGVTYLRSKVAREAESTIGNIYDRVYNAERPELFFKSLGWRVAGPENRIRVRPDSGWNVPEPELTLVANSQGEIVGYCAGNDVSSREIEGDNPLYLPQAKVYNGACALGPSLRLVDDLRQLSEMPVHLDIVRAGSLLVQGDTSTKLIQRPFDQLVSYLFRDLTFPQGAFLMTGTGIVPPDGFSLRPGDTVRVTVGDLVLENQVDG